MYKCIHMFFFQIYIYIYLYFHIFKCIDVFTAVYKRSICIYIYPRRQSWSLTSTCRNAMFTQWNIEVVKSLDLPTSTFPILLLLSHWAQISALPNSMKRALSKSQGLRSARCQVGFVIILPHDPTPFCAYWPKESVSLAGSEVPPPPCHAVGQSLPLVLFTWEMVVRQIQAL